MFRLMPGGGYATVVVIPLRTAEAVCLATEQVQGLANLDVPLLLFLDRIDEVRLDIELPEEKPFRRVLQRRQHRVGRVGSLEDSCELYQVDVGDRHRFMVVRREVERSRVLDAVKETTMVPQLRRWRDWKGTPCCLHCGEPEEAHCPCRASRRLPSDERNRTAPRWVISMPRSSPYRRRSADPASRRTRRSWRRPSRRAPLPQFRLAE